MRENIVIRRFDRWELGESTQDDDLKSQPKGWFFVKINTEDCYGNLKIPPNSAETERGSLSRNERFRD